MQKDKLIRDIEVMLRADLDDRDISAVMGKIIIALENYDVTERTYEIMRYDDRNDKLLKTYCACLAIDGKSGKTIAKYRRSVQKLGDAMGNKPYTDMTTYDVRLYLAMEKQRGVSNRSLENTRADLSAFFQWLAAEGYAEKNPMARIKPVRYDEEVRLPYSVTDIDRLRTACKRTVERAIIEVLLSTGVRIAEFCALDLADISLKEKTVIVRKGKGGKGRTVYLNDLAMMHLNRYLMTRQGDGPALFLNCRGERYTAGGVEHVLKTVGRRAGVDDVHPHRFRRTLATQLSQRGMAVQDIQRILGHSDIGTTMIYVHVSDEQTKMDYQRYTA